MISWFLQTKLAFAALRCFPMSRGLPERKLKQPNGSAFSGFAAWISHAAIPLPVIVTVWICLFLTGNTSLGALDPAGLEYFEKHVRPLLVDHCYECHSATAKKLKGGLLLDTREGVLKGGDSGPALVPGDPEKSLIIKAVRYTDAELQMPPKDKRLTPEQVSHLEAWIKLGAPDPRESGLGQPLPEKPKQDHWAFQPVRRPELPRVANASWIASPVDAFILDGLEKKSLHPSPRADARTLARRAYYDLTGLPPSFAEVRAFEKDASPQAFGALVERLLQSPSYGERWGRYWLDIARYADTKGYLAGDEQRRYAYSYTYRDYVIRAFNEDLPFDRFILEQIAADKLDLKDNQQPLAALGFLTLGRRFLNNQPDIIDDRIDVVTRGLMGLTVACARCHDHKFDPIPTADYYSLYGVFSNSHEPEEKPLLGTVPSKERHEAYLEEKHKRQEELDKFRADKVAEGLAKLRTKAGDYLLAAYEVKTKKMGERIDRFSQDRKLVPEVVRRWVNSLDTWSQNHHPVWAPWFAYAEIPESELPEKSKDIAARFASGGDAEHPINARVAAMFKDKAPGTMKELAEAYGQLLREADSAWRELLKAESEKPACLPEAGQEALRQVLYAEDAPANLPASESSALLGDAVPRLRQLRAKIDEVDATHDGAPPRAMAMADNTNIRKPHVFVRGNAGNPGAEVPIQFLEVLAGKNRQSFTNGSGRLELAMAIASTNNPLTARVLVNRVWMYHFGSPLVRTPSDFGSRAAPPSNPALLDYLAARFMEEGWSVKKLHGLIMNSSAYQQASDDQPQAAQVDPDNSLLWRMNRRRLDFEAMRDTLLAIPGTLNPSAVGHSVEITTEPFDAHRTVYGFIERQNLPGLFRTFDFASPDTTSPQRFSTTVPQQALFLMNSPFVVQQAARWVRRSEISSLASSEAKLRELFHIAYQREPAAEELELALAFLSQSALEESEAQSPWRYGWGTYDPSAYAIRKFTPLPHFNNYAWQGGPELPDPKLGWVLLRAEGGHPGNQDHCAVRRWIAPRDGTVSIQGNLEHPEDKGDGVRARILSSSQGVLGQWTAFHGQSSIRVEAVHVRRGDMLDFVTDCQANESYDSFQWAPRIEYRPQAERGKGDVALIWDAKEDFSGPPSAVASGKRPDPMQELAQVLLLSNELFFVD